MPGDVRLFLMSTAESLDPELYSRLVDNLYVEAMVLADEARAYFDGPGMEDRERLGAIVRLSFACESLKVTTRLMHVIAWLLTQKAWRRGEVGRDVLESEQYRLGEAAPSETAAVDAMPARARALVQDSQSLYDRVRRLQERSRRTASAPERTGDGAVPGPARELLARLERSF